MEILLEFVDTFIADYAYAYLFPIGHVNTSTQATATWVWRPATNFFYVQPYEAAYMSSLTRDNPCRQMFTIFFISWLFGITTYFIFATLSYYLIFDRRCMNHPKFMKNQIWLEIKITNKALPIIAIIGTPVLLLGVRGYAKLYDTTADGPGWWYDILQIPIFLVYADFCTYWIHRLGHHPRVYKHMHKLHHRFVKPTPYSSFAIHPIEGSAQSLSYLIFPFILPLQKMVSIGLYAFIIVWNVGAHDGGFLSNNRIVNGAACHSLHHTYRNCNYGQYVTLFDRLHGTYREPENFMFQNERWMSEMQTKNESERLKALSKENNNKNECSNGKDHVYSKNKKYE